MAGIKFKELSRDVEINKEEMRLVFGGMDYEPSYEDRGGSGYTGWGVEPSLDDAEDRWNAIKILTRLGCDSLAKAV